jgi:hypothetical protein
MKRNRLWIAVLFLLLPVLVRTAWFYRGVYRAPETIATPDYASFKMPETVLSTPIPKETAAAKNEDASQAVVLIDINHDNLYTTTELQPLFDRITELGGAIQLSDYDKSLDEALKLADSYVVLAPTLSFLTGDLESIRRFVDRGGKLLVIADPTRDMSTYGYYFGNTASYLQSVTIVNTLVEPFGITFVEDYLYNLQENEANFRNILLDEMDPNNGLTRDIERAVFYGTHSLETSQEALILTGKTTFSSRTDAGANYIVAASASQGNVLALGDFTFMTNPYDQTRDNQQLVKNIAGFLAGEKRVRTIRDFPYLLNRQTGFWVEKDAAITQDKLGTFSLLQSTLDNVNVKLTLTEKSLTGYDLLVVGKYSQYEKLKDFLEPFDLEFENIPAETEDTNGDTSFDFEITPPEPTEDGTPTLAVEEDTSATVEPAPESEISDLLSMLESNGDQEVIEGTVTIPGFGKFSTDGIGLILFDRQEKRSTLVLLAGNKDGLIDLTGYFTAGSLSGCACYKNMAICPVTKDGNSDGSYGLQSSD